MKKSLIDAVATPLGEIVSRKGEAAPDWPERLTLRDTKVHADEGQRIYSTATGYGYEKREYVRADRIADLVQENERLERENYELRQRISDDEGTVAHASAFHAAMEAAEQENERLRERCVAQVGQIGTGAAEIARLTKERDEGIAFGWKSASGLIQTHRDMQEKATARAEAAEAALASTREPEELRALSEAPEGAIHNGRVLADRLEAYAFECEAGPLQNCWEWTELRRCFESMAAALASAPVGRESDASPKISVEEVFAKLRAYRDAPVGRETGPGVKTVLWEDGPNAIQFEETEIIENPNTPPPAETGPGVEEDEPACPVCGNEVRGQGGYLQCECPAPPLPAETASPPAGVDETARLKRELAELSDAHEALEQIHWGDLDRIERLERDAYDLQQAVNYAESTIAPPSAGVTAPVVAVYEMPVRVRTALEHAESRLVQVEEFRAGNRVTCPACRGAIALVRTVLFPSESVTEPSVAWQPISTAPKNGTEVDLWFQSYELKSRDSDAMRLSAGFRIAGAIWYGGDWTQNDGNPLELEGWGRDWQFTHWIRPPAPPSAPNVEG